MVDKQSRKRQLGYGPLRKSRDTDGEQRVRREIAILQKCFHPHVVRLQEVIDDYSSKKIYMGKTRIYAYSITVVTHVSLFQF